MQLEKYYPIAQMAKIRLIWSPSSQLNLSTTQVNLSYTWQVLMSNLCSSSGSFGVLKNDGLDGNRSFCLKTQKPLRNMEGPGLPDFLVQFTKTR
jgi:hypothetical protein